MGSPMKEKILIAEDSPPNRKILAHLLEKLGFEVVACEDGQEALNKLKEEEHKDVVAIISDIMMPNVDGIQLLQTVRNSEAPWKDIPFILVTALSDKDHIVKAKGLNVNGYILKPVTFQRVSSKLQEIFPDKQFPKLTA